MPMPQYVKGYRFKHLVLDADGLDVSHDMRTFEGITSGETYAYCEACRIAILIQSEQL